MTKTGKILVAIFAAANLGVAADIVHSCAAGQSSGKTDSQSVLSHTVTAQTIFKTSEVFKGAPKAVTVPVTLGFIAGGLCVVRGLFAGSVIGDHMYPALGR